MIATEPSARTVFNAFIASSLCISHSSLAPPIEHAINFSMSSATWSLVAKNDNRELKFDSITNI